MATDRQTDGQTDKPKTRDNVLFASLLIGLSVEFFAMVARVRACGVRECVRACVRVCVRLCVCVLLSRRCNENSQTLFCKHPTFINIHVTKQYMYTSTTTSK